MAEAHETQLRPLTPEERAEVEASRAAFVASWQKATASGREVWIGPVIMLTLAVAFAALGKVPVALFVGLMGSVFLAVAIKARSQQRAVPSTTPWDEPPEGFQIRETVLRATAVGVAIDELGDGQTWLIYQLTDGQLFCLEADDTALLTPPSQVAGAEIRLRELVVGDAEAGYLLEQKASEPAIPIYGWTPKDFGDNDIADAVEAGFVWSPPEDTEGRILPASAAPAWMGDAATGGQGSENAEDAQV